MQIPILSGIYTNNSADIRVLYPRNMTPVALQSGISAGYLRPADGIVSLGLGPGTGRGGINWNGSCYRVMGTKLVRIDADGNIQLIGDVSGSGPVSFDYSFDRLAVASGNHLWLYDGSVLQQVTDADMGTVLDFVWVDGYFMTTDGVYLVVTELNNPFEVNPLKYGSSEADPDPVKALLKLRNEVYALNRHTIEVFDNVGGENFPFARIEGAQIQKGTLGTHSCCIFLEALAFLGSGRNEAPSVWIGLNGQTTKLASVEIDRILLNYTEEQLADVTLEARVHDGTQQLYMHLPNQTFVYDQVLSALNGEPVWFILSSGLFEPSRYRARSFVWCYNKWMVEDPTSAEHGYFTSDVATHYGAKIGWEFGTLVIYNEGRGALFHELELIALPGRVAFGVDPMIWTQYSQDGRVWSMERSVRAGKQGDTLKRMVWFSQGGMRNWRVQRFRGTSDAHLPIARLEARLEPLAN